MNSFYTHTTDKELVASLVLSFGDEGAAFELPFQLWVKMGVEKLVSEIRYNQKREIFYVDEKDMFVSFPKTASEIVRVVGLDENDCSLLLYRNDSLTTTKINKPEDDLKCDSCDDIIKNAEVVEEYVSINGVSYLKTSKFYVDNRGKGYVKIHEPVWSKSENKVVYVDSADVVCDFEVDEDGCVLNNEKNKNLLATRCLPYCSYCEECFTDDVIPFMAQGQVNVDYSHCRIYFNVPGIKKVIVKYTSNEMVFDDIMYVPRFMAEYLFDYARIMKKQTGGSPVSAMEYRMLSSKKNRIKRKLTGFNFYSFVRSIRKNIPKNYRRPNVRSLLCSRC